MSRNKVKERCQREEIAKFYYTAQKMFSELKVSRGILYVVAIIPVVLAFIPATATAAFILSIISFLLSLLNEALSSFTSEYKKKAIMEYQLYETGITGSDFAKIEYDRETTNELNELAIRKGLPQMRGREKLYEPYVPDDMSDDYSYIYLCRKSAATTKYLLSRVFYIYFVFLILLAIGFVFAILAMSEPIEYMTLLITSYPLVSPIIKACGKCKECMKECTKLCADIDNYFADGDVSYERLARMYYYVQTLEFEMITTRPAIYGLYSRLFKNGTDDLEEGVTSRFQSAIVELKSKSMVQKGIISAPKGRELITRDSYDMDTLEKIANGKKQKSKTVKIVSKEHSTETIKPQTKTPAAKSAQPKNKTENS
ncbi:MAG: hypothetical protein J1G07_04945 [Clostridiales bacterium]|nr:hypothetical protein [Clostridiales bacterium]